MPELNLQALYASQAAAVDIVFGMTAKTLDAYQKLTALREDFQQVADAHYEASRCSLQDVIDSLSQQTAPGDALSAWLAALTSANTLFESVHQASKEAVALTESQLPNTAANVGVTQRTKAQSARAAAKL